MTALANDAVPAWLASEIDAVPEIDGFLDTDELAAATLTTAAGRYKEVSIREIGRSTAGTPLVCLTIDAGPSARADALVVGMPHPNETVGSLTSLHLARRLATNPALLHRLGLTWHIVTNIDPDGLRLNEGWLRGPFTREHYARHFYRQAFAEQIDWNFPLDPVDGPGSGQAPPETRALMDLIDEYQPALLAPLHNAEIGGVFHYLSRDEPSLHPVLQRLPSLLGLSLHGGIAEAPWVRSHAIGIHSILDARDGVTDRQSQGGPPSQVSDLNCSAAYAAARHHTLALITEVPLWRDPRSSDRTPTEDSLNDVLIHGGLLMSRLSTTLSAILSATDGSAVRDSPLLRASRHFTEAAGAAAGTMFRPDPEQNLRLATVAERASVIESVHTFRLRNGGMLLRALEEVPPTGPIRVARDQLAATFHGWVAEAQADAEEAGIRLNPIRSLVSVQYASVLAAAHHVARAGP